jgi:hypothetical protein
MAANGGTNVEFNVIDQRQAGSPPVETSVATGSDGRVMATAIVRGGLNEMQRSGELGKFFRQGYGLRSAPR